jgi:hypothetical protein
MLELFTRNLIEVVKAVTPLLAVVAVLQFAVIDAPLDLFVQFVVGTLLAMAGMLLLFVGIDVGIVPMGRFIGAELPLKGSLALIVAVAALLGFATTVAEPEVLVLAGQVDEASGGQIPQYLIVYVMAAGIAAFAGLAMARVVVGWSMKVLVGGAYLVMLALAVLVSDGFVSIAFDAGSVTTGILTAPVIIALAIGLSSVLAGRDPVADGFGILGFAAIGPVLAVLAMGLFWR